MNKRVMNGSVVSSIDLPKAREINQKCQYWNDVFYHGDPLSDFEKDLQRIYLSNKASKHQKYEKRKIGRFKVEWTVSDLNRYQEQENYRMCDPEYFGTAKPIFMPFDLDVVMKCMKIHQDIQQASHFKRALSYFTDQQIMERGSKRSGLQAQALM